MSENLTMSELMDRFELKHFHKGEIVKGKVISVKNDEIIVNIGHFADGVVPRNEISNDKNFDINSLMRKKSVKTSVNTKELTSFFEQFLERKLEKEEIRIIKKAYILGKKGAFDMDKY